MKEESKSERGTNVVEIDNLKYMCPDGGPWSGGQGGRIVSKGLRVRIPRPDNIYLLYNCIDVWNDLKTKRGGDGPLKMYIAWAKLKVSMVAIVCTFR